MNLTWVQLNCLLKGIGQVNDIRSKEIEKNKNKNKIKSGKKNNSTPEINDAMSLLTLPGFNLSKQAKEKLIQIMKDRKQKKEEQKNG